LKGEILEDPNLDEWISEYPEQKRFILSPFMYSFFSTTRPPRGKRIGETQWNRIIAQLQQIKSDDE
jgi:hypothetical protein